MLCGVARRAYKSCGQPPRVDEAVLMQSLPAKSHPHEGAVSAVSEDLASSGRERAEVNAHRHFGSQTHPCH